MEKKKGLIDGDTMAAAQASVAGLSDTAAPTLKSVKAATVLKVLVPVVLMALPAVATLVPQIAPFVGVINGLAKLFGYGA